MRIALGGGNWVLLLLIILSILSIALIVEKAILYWRWGRDTKKLLAEVKENLESDSLEKLHTHLHNPSPVSIIIEAGLSAVPFGPKAIVEAMEGEKITVRMYLEKRLSFLGTLGANAPFIGLFGTVLGIIHAFKDLSVSGEGGQSVMAGISEALVATAVGLFVAIPAAIFFNVFKKKASDMMAYADSLSHFILKTFYRNEGVKNDED
jgi:biopolymer transport protein ExbB